MKPIAPCANADGERLRRIEPQLRLRAAVLMKIRQFFNERGYLEVETPCLVPSPGTEVHIEAFQLSDGQGYLIPSPELQMKRLVAGGLQKIFQLGHCFRKGEQGTRHNREFTMLEWYCAHMTSRALMDETEELLRAIMTRFAPTDKRFAKRFLRMTIAEAFERFADLDRVCMLTLSEKNEQAYFQLWIDRVEPGLAQLDVPLFVYDFPASQASLARIKCDDPCLCERFELYVGDLELSNGFGELVDPVEQRARFEADQARRRARGQPIYPIDERFMMALTHGMPNTSGNALGIDRLLMLCSDCDNIEEVQAFPCNLL